MALGFFRKKEVFADRIFYNGHIYTMDQGLPWAEAVAVRDGKVMTVGSFSEMDSITGEDTELIDLGEKYMFPGFIDVHHSPVMKMINESYSISEEEEQEAEEAETKNIFASLDHAVAEFDDEEEETAEKVSEEVPEEKEDLTEYYVDNSEFTAKVETVLDGLADRGITSWVSLKTPNEIENEFTDSLVELYTEGTLKERFNGALFVNRPVPARFVKEVLSMRRTKCVELDDMVRNEILHLVLDSSEGRQFPQKDLNDILSECSDRSFTIFIEAVEHEDLLKAYRAVDHVRNRGYKNTILIISDEDLTDEEDSELSSSGTAYLTWRADEMGVSYFEGVIDDPEEAIEHLTLESAAFLGMEDLLGSIEKGKYADFTVFSENLLEKKPGEYSRLTSDMTVVNGEIVHDVQAENEEFMLDMMLHNR